MALVSMEARGHDFCVPMYIPFKSAREEEVNQRVSSAKGGHGSRATSRRPELLKRAEMTSPEGSSRQHRGTVSRPGPSPDRDRPATGTGILRSVVYWKHLRSRLRPCRLSSCVLFPLPWRWSSLRRDAN